MTGGVEEHPEGHPRLVVGLRRPQLQDRGLTDVEIVHVDVEVQLLGPVLTGQSGAAYPSTCWKQRVWP